MTGQEAGGGSGDQRLSSAHSEKLGGPALLGEVLNPLHRGAKAGLYPGSSRVGRKWQLPPNVVQIRAMDGTQGRCRKAGCVRGVGGD